VYSGFNLLSREAFFSVPLYLCCKIFLGDIKNTFAASVVRIILMTAKKEQCNKKIINYFTNLQERYMQWSLNLSKGRMPDSPTRSGAISDKIQGECAKNNPDAMLSKSATDLASMSGSDIEKLLFGISGSPNRTGVAE